MAKKNIPIDKEAFEYLKRRVIEELNINLGSDKAYNDLCEYLNAKNEHFPEPTNKKKEIIQRRETISPDTLRRYWGEKDADKEMKPNVGKLALLTQVIGYKNWEEFYIEYKNNLNKEYIKTETPIFSNPKDIDVPSLSEGKIISLGIPQKYITIKYLGDFTFEVVKTVNVQINETKFMTTGFQICRDENSSLPQIIIESFYDDGSDEDIII